MSVQIYYPNLIDSLIEFRYCHPNALEANASVINFMGNLEMTNFIPMIIGIPKSNLVYLRFDTELNLWNMYHSNTDSQFNDIIQREFGHWSDIISKEDNYLGIVDNNSCFLIQCVFTPPKQGYHFVYAFCRHCFDTDNKQMYTRSYGTDSKLDIYPMDNFSNIFIPNTDKIICLNSTSPLDLIFSSIHLGSYGQTICNALYYVNRLSKNFRNELNIIHDMKPDNIYNQIYQYIYHNDCDYFKQKMANMKAEISKIFAQFRIAFEIKPNIQTQTKFIANLVNNFRKELAIELCLVYHRFRHFPHERLSINQKYSHNPFIKLVKLVHQNYLGSRKFVRSDDIAQIFYGTMINSELINLREAIQKRQQLFVPLYLEYQNTIQKNIKPKYQISYNYFPLKVFSPYLFIMGHWVSLV